MDESLQITPAGLKILETLDCYFFLTAQQFEQTGHFKSGRFVRTLLHEFAKHRPPLVHTKDFGVAPGYGRLHIFFALSEYGAEILAEHRQCHVSEIRHLTGKIQFIADYHHRKAFIETHIEIRKWAERVGAEVEFFQGYFETEGANRTESGELKLKKKNRIDLEGSGRYIIPDGIFSFTLGDKKRLCALEIHRGKDSKLITEQLDKHMEIVYSKTLQNRYKLASSNFVLSVYENESIMESVKRRMLEKSYFRDISRAFHFATIAGVQSNLENAWTLADGSPISLFT